MYCLPFFELRLLITHLISLSFFSAKRPKLSITQVVRNRSELLALEVVTTGPELLITHVVTTRSDMFTVDAVTTDQNY